MYGNKPQSPLRPQRNAFLGFFDIIEYAIDKEDAIDKTVIRIDNMGDYIPDS